MGSQGNLQLVAQNEVFEDQFGVASKERADQAKNQLEEFDHRGRLAAGSCEPLPSPNHQPGISRAAVPRIRIYFCPPTPTGWLPNTSPRIRVVFVLSQHIPGTSLSPIGKQPDIVGRDIQEVAEQIIQRDH